MTPALEQQIRERAYHLWMADGCPHERADQHWLMAEAEMLPASAKPAKEARKKTTAKKVERSEAVKPARTTSRRKAGATAMETAGA